MPFLSPNQQCQSTEAQQLSINTILLLLFNWHIFPENNPSLARFSKGIPKKNIWDYIIFLSWIKQCQSKEKATAVVF